MPQVVGEFGGHAPDAGADLGVWAARLTHLLSSSQWGSDSASAAAAGAAGTGAAGAAGAGASEAGAGAGAAASGAAAGAVDSAQVERQRSFRQDEFDPEVSIRIPWSKLGGRSSLTVLNCAIDKIHTSACAVSWLCQAAECVQQQSVFSSMGAFEGCL